MLKVRDVAHKNGNPRDNRVSNLTVKSASQNRSFKGLVMRKRKTRGHNGKTKKEI